MSADLGIPEITVPAGFQSVIFEPKLVLNEKGDNYRSVANETDKTLAIRPIKVGRVVDGVVQVLDGLKPGDKVVTSGAVFIDRAAAGD